MPSANQLGSQGWACLAPRAASNTEEAAQQYPEASYYRARYYDPSTGRFLSEDVSVRFLPSVLGLRIDSRSLRPQTLLVPQSQNSSQLIEWITAVVEADSFDLGHAVRIC